MSVKDKIEQSNTEGAVPELEFGRGKLIDILAERISDHFKNDAHGIERSLTIGIHGEWGNSSTVLVALARHRKFKTTPSRYPCYVF